MVTRYPLPKEYPLDVVGDPVLAKDYPAQIRAFYRRVLRQARPTDRHRHLLRLGEASIAYFASLSFSDYRAVRRGDQDRTTEDRLSKAGPLTCGDHFGLFRTSQNALGRTVIFDVRGYDVSPKLVDGSRLVNSMRAVEQAVRLGADNVALAVDEGLRNPGKMVRWFHFWGDFVAYRNKCVHAYDNGWPVDRPDYYAVMAPLLEAALVEALRTEYAESVLLDYPIARLYDIKWRGPGLELGFEVEHRGVPSLESVTVPTPPEGPSDLQEEAAYVLARDDDASTWALYTRFYDLRRTGVEAELVPRPSLPMTEQLLDERAVGETPQEIVASDAIGADDAGEFGEAADVKDPEVWFALAHWGKETEHLSPWQRQFAFGLGLRLKSGREATPRQAPYAREIIDKAHRLGFNLEVADTT
jgi:hypothetical protein